MDPIPAIVGETGQAVDARPLIHAGILSESSCGAAPDHSAPGRSLFDRLGDDALYASLLRMLGSDADALAQALASQFEDDDPGPLRSAYGDELRRWHAALWRLADQRITVELRDPSETVLAVCRPVRARRRNVNG